MSSGSSNGSETVHLIVFNHFRAPLPNGTWAYYVMPERELLHIGLRNYQCYAGPQIWFNASYEGPIFGGVGIQQGNHWYLPNGDRCPTDTAINIRSPSGRIPVRVLLISTMGEYAELDVEVMVRRQSPQH